jgi:hypothetical protein
VGTPVEEALRLMAVERDVGRVQVEHDLAGRCGGRLEVELRQQSVDGLGRVRDLVIAGVAARQFEPVQRALAGQRLVHFALAAEQRKQRIGAQLLVIVEVFVAQRQPEEALSQHLRQLVLDQQGRAAIAEAARQPPQKVDPAIHFAQQQSPAVARNLARGEPGFHTARKMRCKRERFLITLCHQKGRLSSAITTCSQRSYAMKQRPFQVLSKSQNPKCISLVRNAG